MTAHDLATVAMRTIKDFPQFYEIYGEKEFTFNKITQGNRNPLLYKDLGADGLKTGHTEEAGYSLVGSAKRGDRRVLVVLSGLPSSKARAQESERLIEWAFREYNTVPLFTAGATVDEAAVWLGERPKVPLTVAKDLVVTVPRKSRKDMKVTVAYDQPVAAPIKKGQPLGKIVVTIPEMAPVETPACRRSRCRAPGSARANRERRRAHDLGQLELTGQGAVTEAARGRFITVEGGEGAGKSTQVDALVATLERSGIPALRTREPGGSAGAEAIRELLLAGADERWDAMTEVLLLNAARRDHVDAPDPAGARTRCVGRVRSLCRFDDRLSGLWPRCRDCRADGGASSCGRRFPAGSDLDPRSPGRRGAGARGAARRWRRRGRPLRAIGPRISRAAARRISDDRRRESRAAAC